MDHYRWESDKDEVTVRDLVQELLKLDQTKKVYVNDSYMQEAYPFRSMYEDEEENIVIT